MSIKQAQEVKISIGLENPQICGTPTFFICANLTSPIEVYTWSIGENKFGP